MDNLGVVRPLPLPLPLPSRRLSAGALAIHIKEANHDEGGIEGDGEQ